MTPGDVAPGADALGAGIAKIGTAVLELNTAVSSDWPAARAASIRTAREKLSEGNDLLAMALVEINREEHRMTDDEQREAIHHEISEFMDKFVEADVDPTDEEVREFFTKVAPHLCDGEEEQERFVEMMMKLREPLPGEEPGD